MDFSSHSHRSESFTLRKVFFCTKTLFAQMESSTIRDGRMWSSEIDAHRDVACCLLIWRFDALFNSRLDGVSHKKPEIREIHDTADD